MLAQLAQNGMSFVDTIMVGRLGGGPLAGMALGGVVFNMTYLLTMALVMSVSPLAAQAVGARDPGRAAVVARHGLLLALLLAVPATAFVYFAGPLLGFLGQDPAVVAGATEYLRGVCFGLLGAIGMVSLRGFLEGHGTTRPIMVIALFGVLVNIAANEVLIFGRLGAPALGLAGAGYATSITYTLMAVLLALFVRWRHPSEPVFRQWRAFDARLVRELLTVGWPIALTLGFEVGLFTSASLVMGFFGAAPLAGHQIAMQTVSMAFMVLRGLKDTRIPMFITLLAYWLVGMPVGLLFAFVVDLGPRGMWFGLVISLVVAAALLTRRFWWQTRRPAGAS